MCYYFAFGFFCVAMIGVFYPLVYMNTDWNPYVVWVAALSATAFLMYGLDKLLSEIKIWEVRTPNLVLHVLAVLGGFPGGWAGMMVFHHKTNIRKHPDFWAVLTLSTLGHAVLTYYWFFMQGG